MKNSDDPLDLLDDDGDGIVEMSLLEEEEKLKRSRGNKNSGCCVVFLILITPLIAAGWYLI